MKISALTSISNTSKDGKQAEKKKKAGEIEGMLDDKQSSTVYNNNVPLVPIVVIYVCAKNY